MHQLNGLFRRIIFFIKFAEIGKKCNENHILTSEPGLADYVAYRRSEQSVGSTTVRRYFVPDIKYISYKDLPTVYSEMVSRSQNMSNITSRVSSVNWPFMSKQLEKVKNFSDAAK